MTKTVTLEPQEIEHLRYWHAEQARYNESKGWDETANWHRARLANINSPAEPTGECTHGIGPGMLSDQIGIRGTFVCPHCRQTVSHPEPPADPDDAPDATAQFAETVAYAERYRWLRSKGPAIRQEITASGFAHEVDQRIDKARAAENRGEEHGR